MLNNLTEEDINFLKELAHERRTQDKDGCADSVFWMIYDKQNVYNDDGEYFEIYSDEGDGVLYSSFDKNSEEDLEEIKEYCLSKSNIPEFLEKELLNISNDNELYDFLEVNDIDVNFRSFDRLPYISTMTGPFLTKKAAKKHIEENYYHYSKDVTTYGIVGWRNPEFYTLMKIIEKFDEVRIDV